MNTSNKLDVLFALLKDLHDAGHKVLIFSKTKILLNVVAELIAETYSFLRLDGDVLISNRDKLCKKFNDNASIFCFLLTN